jgi:signal transduction histidine kinase
MKTTSKITLFLILSNIILLVIFGGGIYYFQNAYSYIDFYKRLETRASIAAKYNLEQDELTADSYKKIRNQHLEKLTEEKEYLIELDEQPDADEIARTNNLPKSLVNEVLSNEKGNYKDGNLFFGAILYQHGNTKYMVVVSAENYYASHHLNFLRTILLIGIIVILLVSILISFYFTKYIFNPIKAITGKVKVISTENIHLRLDEEDSNSEIGELKSTFNDLLNRMETAFEAQKNFISNASHELGTPLTAIIGEADVTLIKNRSPEEYRETLSNILGQAERLDDILKSLIFLAQTGYEGKKIPFEILRLDDVLWEVKKVVDKLNPQNDIRIDLSLLPEDPKKLKVSGNRQLLHLAFANLFNNSCKYSKNKPVTVSLGSGNSMIHVVIRDEGVGIPEDEMAFIYDPFFRATNTKMFEGYGIGLPLTRNIVRLHQGSIEVLSVLNTGTTVRISLPLQYPENTF